MNELLKEFLNGVEENLDNLTDPSKYDRREDMGGDFQTFLGYDPTRIWDEKLMSEQIDKLASSNNFSCKYDEREDLVKQSLEHFDAIKPNVMLHVAQKTIKQMFHREVTSDDLNLDLDYLMNNEIFGIGYDADDEDEEDDFEEDSISSDDEDEDDGSLYDEI